MKTLAQEIEEVRDNKVENLKGLLLSRRGSRDNEVAEIIKSSAEGIVEVEKVDSFEVKVRIGDHFRHFYLLDENESEEDINPNDLRGLARFLIDMATYDYAKDFVNTMQKNRK